MVPSIVNKIFPISFQQKSFRHVLKSRSTVIKKI